MQASAVRCDVEIDVGAEKNEVGKKYGEVQVKSSRQIITSVIHHGI